ncbi:hypothetical protein VTJ49DRAFT_5761 [Mycothermus thermophilus]|uniref:FACT complex subunit n=1 Tax=Humicola insolens TaxID=85995 RepID=A0ABR3V2G0_HUMIN
MADIKIDTKTFQERLSHFIAAWKADKRSGDALFAGASSIVILMGKVDQEQEFHKNNAMHVRFPLSSSTDTSRDAHKPFVFKTADDLQFWLLGYEFPGTLMLFTLDTLYILTTQKKAKYLDQIKGGRFPVEVLVRGKDNAENEKLFIKITDAIKAAGVSHEPCRDAAFRFKR